MKFFTHAIGTDLSRSDQIVVRKPLCILVVEDDVSLKKVILRSLKILDENIEVEWATSADQFFLSKREFKRTGLKCFDLVLADINMPGTNSGLQVWNHFKMLDPTIPVVIMSGLKEKDFKKKIGAKVLVHYVQKPLNLKKCAAILDLCNW